MLKKNALVIYKLQPAVITETGEKYTVSFCVRPASPGGKPAQYATQKVRDKDISLLHEGPVSSLEKVLETADNAALIAGTTEKIQEAHELLISDKETATAPLSVQELAELACGGFPADSAWLFYRVLCSTPYFSAAQTEADNGFYFTPRTPEEITGIQNKQYAKEHEASLRQEFIARLKKKQITPADRQYMQEVEALALGKTDKSKIMKDAGFSETPEKAHKLLLDTGVWDITKNPHPIRMGLSMQSAAEHLSHPPEEDRLTVSHTAYAIDNAWSTDPDDAIAFDGTYLWVHIADPASTVQPDSSIDIAARNRGSTLYIPEGASRMLAEESLEDYALGLCETENGVPTDKKSRALSFRIQLDDTAAVTDAAVFRTYVQVQRLTYEQADEQKDSPGLAPLFAIAERNIQRRTKAGAVSIELPEVHITVEPDTDGLRKTVAIHTVSHQQSGTVVREIMLLAGEAAAKFAFKNAIAFPYVSQEAPDIPKDIPDGLAGQYKLRRCMRSRSVGVTPAAHAGLGLGMYSQVTSPLRRYSDLVAHQQLRAFITGGAPLGKDDMLERISAGDAAAGAAVKAERKSNLHWTLVYLLQHSEWTGTAVAVEVRGKQTVFLIPELALETILTPAAPVSLNGTIQVKAGNINLPELTVTFQQI